MTKTITIAPPTTPLFSTLNLNATLFKTARVPAHSYSKRSMVHLNSKISEFVSEGKTFAEFLQRLVEELNTEAQKDVVGGADEKTKEERAETRRILLDITTVLGRVSHILSEKYQAKLDLSQQEVSNPLKDAQQYRTLNALNDHIVVSPVLDISIDLFLGFKKMSQSQQHQEQGLKNFRAKLQSLVEHNGSLPGSKDELLDLAGLELQRIAIACLTMSMYLLSFCLISHGAAVAATTFAMTAIVLGSLGVWVYLTNHQRDLAVVFDDLSRLLHHLAEKKLPVFSAETALSPRSEDVSDLGSTESSSHQGYEFHFGHDYAGLMNGYQFDDSSLESESQQSGHSYRNLHGTALITYANKMLLSAIPESATEGSAHLPSSTLAPSCLFNARQVVSKECSLASDHSSVIKNPEEEDYVVVDNDPDLEKPYTPCRIS